MLNRLRAAWLAFRDPRTYWEGVSIREIATELLIKDHMAIIRPDPQTDYVVHVLPPREQRAISNYLGW